MTSFKAIVPLKIDPPSLFAVQLPGKASHRALVSLIIPCPRVSFTTLITLSARLTLNITPGSSPGQWVNLANPPPSLDSLGHNSLDEPEEIAQKSMTAMKNIPSKALRSFCVLMSPLL